MRLERVYTRFFKSFNYDYERKAKKGAIPDNWEDVSDGWFPYVKVDIDGHVTAVVGANESGKTQLLDAIKAVLTGERIRRADFCRYSTFYSVQQGKVRSPEFGGDFRVESDDEARELNAALGSDLYVSGDLFTLFRPGDEPPFLIVRTERLVVSAEALASLTGLLPTFYELRTDLAMPDSMSLAELAGGSPSTLNSRRRRFALIETLFGTWDDPTEFGRDIFPNWKRASDVELTDVEKRRRGEFELGRKLLIDVAKIEPESFAELSLALREEKEGNVEGIVGAMNQAIAENLNFQRWWSQDADFTIELEAREREVAFTIRDRTGSKYSFDERSQGLRFFLSYFVQLAAHSAAKVAPDILLLDEPDAYLSSNGQQDLLRVIENYATPEDGSVQNQVVYVTHSPFLINRNASGRIRVLDKGVEDEGTRVVRDASRNHYEPLRSSLGPYVAETAFIGGVNLFVEGAADQVLLSGASVLLAGGTARADTLDLNETTIVASGSATSIPYMVYLARGRDQVKPACVALLDGDAAGAEAAKLLRRGEVRNARILQDEFIVTLDEWAASVADGLRIPDGVVVREIEDLIPVRILVEACRRYISRFQQLDEDALRVLSDRSVISKLSSNGSLWEALVAAYAEAYPGMHVEKVGLAKEVLGVLSEQGRVQPRPSGHAAFETNFGSLLKHLSVLLQHAKQQEADHRSERRLERIIRGFERDHTKGITKSRARMLVREIDASLSDADWANQVRVELHGIERDFGLGQDLNQPLGRFDSFRERVLNLRYAERFFYQQEAISVHSPNGSESTPPLRRKRKT